MQIPSENLYFVLSYAWKRLDRLKSVLEIVQSGRYDLPQDLLGCLLRESFSRLLRRHLDRGYRERDEDTCRPRGKVDFASTIRRALGVRGQAHVRYEELSRDTLQNRVIKTSMRRLAATPDLDIRLKHDFRDLTRRIPDVGEVVLRDELFRSVQIHRNNADYGFLLDICRLLSRHLSPEAGTGNVRFRDFTATDTEMGLLFEEFVRSFLSIEHSDLRVSRGNWEIKWNEVRATDAKRFPVLKTDIHVPSAGGRSAIVETKCESKPFAGAVESSDDSLKSRHLYQLFAYLTNHAHSNSGEPPALGVLLYATVGETFDYRYSVRSHPLWVRSIDLSKPWPKVREDLNCLAADLAGQTRSGMATAA